MILFVISAVTGLFAAHCLAANVSRWTDSKGHAVRAALAFAADIERHRETTRIAADTATVQERLEPGHRVAPASSLTTLSLILRYEAIQLSNIVGKSRDVLVGYISLTGLVIFMDAKPAWLQHFPLHLQALSLALAPLK
jgi:hypothetical protein